MVYRRTVRMRRGSAAWVGLGVVLAGCPGDVAPGGSGADSGSSGDRPGITTFNSTVDPTLPTDGDSVEEGSAEGTTMGVVDGSTTGLGTTEGPGTSEDPTEGPGTSEGTSEGTTGGTSEGTTDPTDPGSTSGPGSTTDPTTGGGCNAVPGNYENCLNMAGVIDNTPCLAPGASTCLYTGAMGAPTAGVCSIQDCVDACDCPAAPASGDAVITCDDVTGVPADLFCYLDCSMGETCPAGMTCFGGYLCIWPGPGAMGVPYGDCFNDPEICGFDGVCLNDGMAPTIGVCTTECMVLGDCAAAPPGGTSPVSCEDVTGDMLSECIIDCSGGATCPTGMTCFGGFLCAWN
jgi:hypothetical protein